MKTYKGRFTPKNPKKYKGDPTNIIFRSGWELRVMKWLDEKTDVVEWSSEELSIAYKSPIDNRAHRYFPDMLAKIRQPNGSIKTVLIEIKPEKQTKEPRKQKKISQRYITEVTTWGVNKAKWEAARNFCADRGWDFMILTEKDIFDE